jgi:molybdate transport system substrate-binding protein
MRTRQPASSLMLAISLIAAAFFRSSCGGSPGTAGTSGPGGTTATTSVAKGEAVELVVSAASDLSPVLAEIEPLFRAESGVILKTNLGSTGQLTEQIANGARVDVFLAASKSAVDQLAAKGLLVPGSEQLYARGRLVVWTRAGSSISPKSLQDLTAPEVKRISLANPIHAPYGKAAKEALQSAGLWDQLQSKLVPAENVRQAYQFAESGNVDVGLVALSLVAQEGGNYVLVPENLHEPISQTLAIVASSTRQLEARKFVDFLTGPQGREIMKKYGFIIPGEE